MSDWAAGYVTDIQYTYGYYTELNPLHVRLAMLHRGLVPPRVVNACELGYGQGLSANIHDAASRITWYGTDFNPAQASFARELAEAAGSSARLFDDSFAEFAARTDLPDFEYIGLHGIWSWISDENREVLIDFIRRKLAPGGVLYVSYNTMPGWANFAPMRHLLAEHAAVLSADGAGVISNVEEAMAFAEKLLATNPTYGRANPQAAERLKQMKSSDRQYLAHEYFNKNWNPLHFSEVAKQMASAKLQFGCSANILDHVDALNLRQEQQEFIRSTPDVTFRETLRDFMVNQQFRRDYWVKGARQLTEMEKVTALRQERVVLRVPRADVSLKARGALGEADMSPQIYNPILDLLADHLPRSIGEIETALRKTHTIAQIVQSVIVMIGAGHVSPAADEATIESAVPTSDALNTAIRRKAVAGHRLVHQSSPVTGGAIALNAIDMMFCSIVAAGANEPGQWATAVTNHFLSTGQQIVRDGKTLGSKEDLYGELLERARVFGEKQLPIMKGLRVI